MLTLHIAPGSSSMAPHIALREVGTPFEVRALSFARKENRDPAAASSMAPTHREEPARRRFSGQPRGVPWWGRHPSGRSTRPAPRKEAVLELVVSWSSCSCC
jgi:hypothetical protein